MSIQTVRNPVPFVDQLPFELAERKGVGHPDTMCDAIAERASRQYSQYCLDHFGGIAHHWFDKVMLIGGESRMDYGVGEIIKPYKLIFAGKAAYSVGSHQIPLEDILRDAAAHVLSEVLTGFDPTRHIETQVVVVDHQGAGRGNSRYRPLSSDDLVKLGDPKRVSNDSNLLSGFAPLSTLERMVLQVERYVNGPEFKRELPFTGWDVKVFGTRFGRHFKLLANVPFLAKDVSSLDDYFQKKSVVQAKIAQFCKATLDVEPELMVNATDRNGRPYLTVLGSVADTGDVGVVGRGNRSNGLITPMRPMSIEAAAGKNPVDHTGKLYTILADRLARSIHEELKLPIDVSIYTSKEAPLQNPDDVFVRVGGSAEPSREQEEKISRIVQESLASVANITRDLVQVGLTLW